MQQIVFNAHYLMYFDTAFADYMRALALPYESTMKALDGDLFVRRAALDYHASARIDDSLDVRLRCDRIGTSSITFAGAIFCGDILLVTCELVYVFANPEAKTSKPVPDALKEILMGYEQGKPTTTVKTGDWQTFEKHAAPLRREVFVEEQKVPEELEWDEGDAVCIHGVVQNLLGEAIATGRLMPSENGVARIGRMAVKRSMRGSRHGKDVLLALMDAARQRGDREIVLHAQTSAKGFYDKLGYKTRGEVFVEADIEHIDMYCEL